MTGFIVTLFFKNTRENNKFLIEVKEEELTETGTESQYKADDPINAMGITKAIEEKVAVLLCSGYAQSYFGRDRGSAAGV